MLKYAVFSLTMIVFLCPSVFAEQAVTHCGGIVLSVPSSEYQEYQGPIEKLENLSESRRQYEEFLSRGTYSRVRSIGGGSNYRGGYSSGGGSGGGARAVRSRLRRPARSRSGFRGNFATINNGSPRLNTGFRNHFARINN